MTKRPSFQFYPADWLRNLNLRACSLEARALWADLLCYMHDAEPYGHLAIDGAPLSDETAARVVGLPVRAYKALLAELEGNKVSSRTENGLLYSRRLVKDHAISEARSSSGAIGGASTQANVKQPVKQLIKQLVEVEEEVEATPRRGIPKGEVSDHFELTWFCYPKRPNNSKERARKAYMARMAEGCDASAILEGVKRYAEYVRRERTEGKYIKQAATFFGPDRHWESDYTPSTPKPAQPTVTYPKIQAPKVEGPAYKPPPEGERDPRMAGLIGSIGRDMPKGAA